MNIKDNMMIIVVLLITIFATLAFCLCDAIYDLREIRKDIYSLDKSLSEKNANAIQTVEATETQKLISIEGSYKVTVIADENFIKTGNYDWVSSKINPGNFDIKDCPLGDIEILIVRVINPISSTEDLVKEMAKEGLRPGNLLELCALGAKELDLQMKFPVVALGSSCVIRGLRCVPYLGGCGSGRYLGLDLWDNVCSADGRFLAVRLFVQVGK